MCRSGVFAQSQVLWRTVADDGSIVGRLLDYVWSYWDNQIEVGTVKVDSKNDMTDASCPSLTCSSG